MQKKPKLRFKEFADNWQEKNLKDVSAMIKDGTHGSFQDVANGIPLLSAKDIENGKVLIPEDCRTISEDDYNSIFKTYKLKLNDILLTIVGTIGRVALVNDIKTKYAFQRSVGIIRLNEMANAKFMTYQLQNEPIRKQFYSRVNQSAQGGIYLETLGKTKIIIPSMLEQEKIASFLSKIDELINEHESEVADLETQKKGLIQKLFTQQIRFKDSNGNSYPVWKEKKLSTIFTEYKEQSNTNNQYEVLTSSRQGLMPQSEYYSGDNRITDRDNIGFNVIPPNYLTYRSRSDDGFFTFNLNDLGITGVISVYYPVFTSTGNNFFIANYLNYHKNILYKYAVGSSQKVLSYRALTGVKLLIPCNDEQEKIANVLGKMDELITEKKALLEDWKQFKKGLLQQMFV